jgi:acyl transferase domain-containing protein/3-hydroxymyristoyl/3-hydroxydecanoyl-(acyl carrier protein) dehydratase
MLGIPAPAAVRSEPLNAFPAGLPASVVAGALGLGGVAYTLDAACGSSLYALKLAIDELRSGRADAMLSGGVSRPDALYTQMGFSQLRALSLRGRAAPLDHRADGLLVGEGAGMFVLKRLTDALSHGDHVYGVVAGIGLSNDLHGDLLAPDTAGQLRALRSAYEQGGWRPDDVDLIECHATGTPRGDAVEVESLKSLWAESGWRPHQCVIGSVKGNIGHALTAAGAAGLLKVLLALKHRVLPPTANFERPAPNLKLEESPFRVLNRPESWPARSPDRPRRAAVSGFGFGGINAHVLIEEWAESPGPSRTVFSQPPPRIEPRQVAAAPPIAIVGISAQIGPIHGKDAFREFVMGRNRPRPTTRPGDEPGNAETPRASWQGSDGGSLPGYYLTSLEFPVGEFRIPPKELGEMLPQQSLMLRVAAEAIGDALWDPRLGVRTSVLIGLGLDLNTTNFHLRWSLADRAREWNRTHGLDLSTEDLERWIEDLRAAAGPALSANRTMGSLGGLVASRIARELRIGGPSFTVSCDETSGIQALAIAVEWLRRGELDAAIVGAVDLAGDWRAVLARRRLGLGSSEAMTRTGSDDATHGDPLSCACDGAVALVLKRLPDARRDGDRIYAVIRGFGSASGRITQGLTAELGLRDAAARPALAQAGLPDDSSVSFHEVQLLCWSQRDEAEDQVLAPIRPRSGENDGPHLGSLVEEIGPAGAAAGLASVAKAALCLDQQILPPSRGSIRWLRDELPFSELASRPRAAQFWLRNRAEGPRRAAVSATSLGRNHAHVILEESPSPEELTTESPPERVQSMGARRLGLFALEGDDDAGLSEGIRELGELARAFPSESIDVLARRWWRRRPNDARLRLGLAIVADGTESLRQFLSIAGNRAARAADDRVPVTRGSIHVARDDAARMPKRVAFVYPGLGNDFEGMGRELSTLWPEVLRAQDSENGYLRDQLEPAVWWNGRHLPAFAGHRVPILGQVGVGSLVTDVLRALGMVPDAAIGYSMGESAALIASRAWSDRDEMLGRLRASSLFESDLAGPCHAARRVWGIPANEPVGWAAGIVPRPAEDVRTAIAGTGRVYLLIKNTVEESVIGGHRRDVEGVVRTLRCPFVELPTVSTVHCEIGRVVEPEYRALHDLETIAPAGIVFYSGVWGQPYALDRRSAADAITAQATRPIDFPAVIERAYEDGVGVFLEAGPGSACTRLIDRILGGRPHLACSACRPDRHALAAVLEVLGECIANRLPVDLASLYAGPDGPDAASTGGSPPSDDLRRLTIRVDVGGRPFPVPPLPSPPRPLAALRVLTMKQEPDPAPAAWSTTATSPSPLVVQSSAAGRVPEPHRRAESLGIGPPSAGPWPLSGLLHDAERARSAAHGAFLRAAEGAMDLIGRHVAFQLELIEEWQHGAHTVSTPEERAGAPPADPASRADSTAVWYDRRQCLELAVGSVAAVFGPDFAEVDRLPTRVRLPDEPLMLVDRILTMEGTPRSLQRGRVVTEHVIQPGAWYLDTDRVAPCIAMEAGQADLVLSGYLGVDFVTRGRAAYRLLDAMVTFHRELPGVGAVLRYDIRITHFFRQGTTILFRFEFDATVAGEPLLTMRDGCAGFFTPEELASGQGIVPRGLEIRPQPRPRAGPDGELIPVSSTHLDERQVEALRQGDLAAAFDGPFDRLLLGDPIALPGGLMALFQRVATLEPTGGPFGLGLIRAEADIRAGEWFMVCHFVDDRVMPGTLMYECCLHALRILMMRLGWVGRRGQVAFEPVPGVANRLKCRGQITESTRRVTYEIVIKERGYRPEPYAVADALIIADGKPIVAVTDLALQLSGTGRGELERLWESR